MKQLLLILLPLMGFMPVFSHGEDTPVLEDKEWALWEEEKLRVLDNFPQYRKNFNPKIIQEKVYQEFLQKKEDEILKKPLG